MKKKIETRPKAPKNAERIDVGGYWAETNPVRFDSLAISLLLSWLKVSVVSEKAKYSNYRTYYLVNENNEILSDISVEEERDRW